MAFTDQAKKYANDNGCNKSLVAEYVGWIIGNYPWKYKIDPVLLWKDRSQAIEKEKDPHKALLKYDNFMNQTEEVRESLVKAVSILDLHIQEEIDKLRGK